MNLSRKLPFMSFPKTLIQRNIFISKTYDCQCGECKLKSLKTLKNCLYNPHRNLISVKEILQFLRKNYFCCLLLNNKVFLRHTWGNRARVFASFVMTVIEKYYTPKLKHGILSFVAKRLNIWRNDRKKARSKF